MDCGNRQLYHLPDRWSHVSIAPVKTFSFYPLRLTLYIVVLGLSIRLTTIWVDEVKFSSLLCVSLLLQLALVLHSHGKVSSLRDL